MKIVIIIIITAIGIFLFSTRTQRVSFTVKAPGMEGGSFFITNQEDSVIFSSSIINGKTNLDKPMLETSGYYTLKADPYNGSPGKPFEIYLEKGHYDISMKDGNYPRIISTSKIQQQLSAYNVIFDSIRHIANKLSRKYSNQLASKSANMLPAQAYINLINKVNSSDSGQANANVAALILFIKRYPENTVAVHLLAGMKYESDPLKYNKIFNSLSNEARNTDEGEETGRKIDRLIRLMPGHPAPLIAGTTPGGEAFSTKNLHKKLYLLEIWKSANTLCRTNHQDLANPALMQKIIPDIKDLGMISVSLDHQRAWWLDAIKEDKLTWPQYADLKGNESLNGLNWNVTHLPVYCLIDDKWRVVENDLDWSEVPIAVNRYLQQH